MVKKVKDGHKWSKGVENGEKRSKMVKNGQKWSKIGQKWTKMVVQPTFTIFYNTRVFKLAVEELISPVSPVWFSVVSMLTIWLSNHIWATVILF